MRVEGFLSLIKASFFYILDEHKIFLTVLFDICSPIKMFFMFVVYAFYLAWMIHKLENVIYFFCIYFEPPRTSHVSFSFRLNLPQSPKFTSSSINLWRDSW